jgi:hypothetical protein
MSETDPSKAAPQRKSRGFFKRREIWMPTWKGWLVLAGVAVLLGWACAMGVYPFLALNRPIREGSIIVEGWVADQTLKEVLEEFGRGSYEKIYVVGGPLDQGATLARYGSYAELGKASLTNLGAPSEKIVAVPAPFVPQDRTYTAFLFLGKYFETNGLPRAVHLISEGAHARRSALMLETVLEGKCGIGVTALDPKQFDARHWWTTSVGFKHVLGETLSYVYARVFFRLA